MLTSDQIKKIDTQDMYKTYENWPEIAEQNYYKKFDK